MTKFEDIEKEQERRRLENLSNEELEEERKNKEKELKRKRILRIIRVWLTYGIGAIIVVYLITLF